MTRWGEGWNEQQVATYLAEKFAKAKPGEVIPLPDGVRATKIQPHKLGRGKRVKIDGYSFPSKKEADRYGELKLLQEAGEIYMLEVHPHWPIDINGVHICEVWLDSSYYDKDGKFIVEDVKKTRRGKDGKIKFTTNTDKSKLKQKLLFACYGISVTIVDE